MHSVNTSNAVKECVVAFVLAALAISTSASLEVAQGGGTPPTTSPFVLLKRFLFGGADAATTTTNATPRSMTTTPRVGAAAPMPPDLTESAAALGISKASLVARGLKPQLPPHNFTMENRDRRELNELDGWMDARTTWYGGPDGPGPDGMSISTGSCGFGTISNHYISAWQGDQPRTSIIYV